MHDADTNDDKDLADLVGEDVFNHPYCFHPTNYSEWEQLIATPAIEATGRKVIRWWTGDGDSFGPLVRCVDIDHNGRRETYSYG